MEYLFFVLFIASSLTITNAYVLLQVRKGDNQSDVDALIHKVVPSERFQKVADNARKQFDGYKYNTKQRNDREGLESIVIAIDSGANQKNNIGTSNTVDRLIKKLSEILQIGAMTVIPKYRSELQKFHIKPEIVYFRSGKPSVMFEINTKAVMRSIQDYLSSNEFRNYVDRVVGKAALVYRSVKEEIMKE